MDPARARKLADRISQIVAEMLERRIKDPRLGNFGGGAPLGDD